jgi:hypothetical protein
LGFEREKIVLNRALSCRPLLLFFSFERKSLVMNKLEKALESITNGAEEVGIVSARLDLESVRCLMAECSTASAKVKKLKLVECGLDAEVVGVISSSLRSHSVVMLLNLGCNEIGPRGAQKLGETLCLNAVLVVLKVYCCFVGDEGACHLAAALRQNRTLEELCLGGNGITHVGAAALAIVLPFNKTLKHLQLSNNPVGDDGVEALAKAVPHSSLRELWLYNTRLREFGCAALVEMLKNGSRLRKLVTASARWPALEEGFHCNGWLLVGAPKQYLERNKAMQLQARKLAYTLLLIRKLRRTALSSFPKEVVREIAQLVYSSRGEISVWQANKQ